MDVVADCEALDAFYRAEEGGDILPWRRNGRQRVEFFNASFSRRREEGVAPISEQQRRMWGSSWFARDGAMGGCSDVAAVGGRSHATYGLT
jgi:hypothetical protein